MSTSSIAWLFGTLQMQLVKYFPFLVSIGVDQLQCNIHTDTHVHKRNEIKQRNQNATNSDQQQPYRYKKLIALGNFLNESYVVKDNM